MTYFHVKKFGSGLATTSRRHDRHHWIDLVEIYNVSENERPAVYPAGAIRIPPPDSCQNRGVFFVTFAGPNTEFIWAQCFAKKLHYFECERCG